VAAEVFGGAADDKVVGAADQEQAAVLALDGLPVNTHGLKTSMIVSLIVYSTVT
jgi:hypothetical protein